MISEFKCSEEPLDALLARLSKLSGVGIKLSKDSFKGKAVPLVPLPALGKNVRRRFAFLMSGSVVRDARKAMNH